MISPVIYKPLNVPFGNRNIKNSGQINTIKPLVPKDFRTLKYSIVHNPIVYIGGIKINKRPSIYDYEKEIPNFSVLSRTSARGETLSSPKNRKYLHTLRANGIKNVIDLREKYSSDKYPELCKKNGLIYHNIPIDSSTVKDRTIIDSMPKLFNIINGRSFYIACAQGLHRTDIALALNYVFNPKEKNIPVMRGHVRNNKLKIDDIARRLNSIKKAITPEDLKKIGWDENFEDEYLKRKKQLFSYNSELIRNQGI